MPATTCVAAKTVLVADDTAFVRDRFTKALEGAGHRAIAIRSGSELLSRLRKELHEIDLVVLDLRLPQSNGVSMVRAIRKIDDSRPKIVVFSGTIASADEVRELATLGVCAYVNEYSALQNIMPALAPHLFPEHLNRRSSPRVALGIAVSYRVGNTIAAAVTLNISRGGLAIRTTSPLEVGTLIKARLRLPSVKNEIETHARVSWIDRRLGMGLEFVNVEPSSQLALDNFVDSHFFTNRKA
jgi:uncharacterized protein (TIGR02266 family)